MSFSNIISYFTLFFLLVTALDVYSQEVISRIDWEQGILEIQIVEDVSREEYNRAGKFFRAEQQISDQIAEYVFESLLDLQVDSWSTLGELARKDASLLRIIEDLSGSIQLIDVEPQNDLEKITARYQLEIYPVLTEVLVRHRSSFPMNEILQWQPGSEYTGIVIYAGRLLPVHGERNTAGKQQMSQLEPALFPVVYDENLRILIDRNRMDPEYAARWGSAAFSSTFNEEDYTDRIGENPMRILATGLFGISPSDPLIPRSDANVLLSSESNRRLLQQGRILIIYSDSF